MSIQTEIDRLASAKAAIKTAIEGKGATVPAGTLLSGMASLIDSIETGGDFDFFNFINTLTGSLSFTFTPAQDEIGTSVVLPSAQNIARFGFVYTEDTSYKYNKSVGCWWLYTATNPFTDIDTGFNIQCHIFTNSTDTTNAFGTRLSKKTLSAASTMGCAQQVINRPYVDVQSQTIRNNKSIFVAGVTYRGVVLYE